MTPGVTLEKLHRRLDRAGVDPDLYSIGQFGEECWCIERTDSATWVTYLGERGQRSHLMTWYDEGDACIHLIGQLAWDGWRAARVLGHDEQ